MKYALQTVLKWSPLVFGGAIMCAGILVAILAGVAAVAMPEASTVPALTDLICPAGSEFKVGKYSYNLPTGESGINLTFGCINASGRKQGGPSDAVMVLGFLGAVTAVFFVFFSLWLFVSTWRRVVRVTQGGQQSP